MQFSPDDMIFRLAIVDPIAVDLIRKFGKNLDDAANRVAPFEATWTEEQNRSHFAADSINPIMAAAHG